MAIDITIPGRRTYSFQHLVLDMNGTIAGDGQIIKGVADRIGALGQQVQVHVVTAGTHGGLTALEEMLGFPVHLLVAGREAEQKEAYVRQLGADRVVAIGNGANDAAMLAEAAVGVIVLGTEGAAVQALLRADVACTSILDALDLLLKPKRLVATLRT